MQTRQLRNFLVLLVLVVLVKSAFFQTQLFAQDEVPAEIPNSIEKEKPEQDIPESSASESGMDDTVIIEPSQQSDTQSETEVQASSVAPDAIGTAFTYQGQLSENGRPANGDYDLQFNLYSAQLSEDIIGRTVIITNLNIISGVFSVELDFGLDAFNGQNRFLEIGVRPAGSNAEISILLPRRNITPSPYAIYADSASYAQYAESASYANRASHADSASVLTRSDGVDALLVDSGGQIMIPNGSDAREGGYIILGPIENLEHSNLTIDNNEIMARKNGGPATLWVNADGGDIYIGGDNMDDDPYNDDVNIGGEDGVKVRTDTRNDTRDVYIGGDNGLWIDNDFNNPAIRARRPSTDDSWAKPFRFIRYNNLLDFGDLGALSDVVDTGISTEDWICGVVGLKPDTSGGAYTIALTTSGTWGIDTGTIALTDVANWGVTLLCVNTLFASTQGLGF